MNAQNAAGNAGTAAAGEAERFLAAHPDLEAVDLLLTDANGVARGKRLRPHELPPVYAHGRYLPGSILGLDLLGHDVHESGLVWDDGDADRLCVPVPGTLARAPWQPRPTAQALLTMHELDGRPAAGDPRHALVRSVAALEALGLRPVVACELEFYLFDAASVAGGRPRPVSSRPHATQVYELDALDAVGEFLAELHAHAAVQGVPSETAISEFAPGQYELTLHHRADALRAADEAILWKRLVKGTAARHGWHASFMAKPLSGHSGSGLHVHVSLADADGCNRFASEDPTGTPLLRHAIAGLARAMPDCQLVFAPHANSYRRYRAGSYAPMTPLWGINNRSVGLRVPAGPAPSRHIEHRVAGADANPYLVLAVVLAAVRAGIEAGEEPGPPVRGNGYEQAGERLPASWREAITRAEASGFLREALGADCLRIFTAIKRQEWERFEAEVTDADWRWGSGL